MGTGCAYTLAHTLCTRLSCVRELPSNVRWMRYMYHPTIADVTDEERKAAEKTGLDIASGVDAEGDDVDEEGGDDEFDVDETPQVCTCMYVCVCVRRVCTNGLCSYPLTQCFCLSAG